ncbi:hypothetical protein Mapa_007938 [Marchantia paleacea]|nr:hypothetical protein Mapa_007938 [Marchantia paleacea]
MSSPPRCNHAPLTTLRHALKCQHQSTHPQTGLLLRVPNTSIPHHGRPCGYASRPDAQRSSMLLLDQRFGCVRWFMVQWDEEEAEKRYILNASQVFRDPALLLPATDSSGYFRFSAS